MISFQLYLERSYYSQLVLRYTTALFLLWNIFINTLQLFTDLVFADFLVTYTPHVATVVFQYVYAVFTFPHRLSFSLPAPN
jgi:hypothetical protein